jgi:hypothetical protein
VDPGEHTFSFERDGAPPIEQRLLVRVGEKNRQLAVRFGGSEGADRDASGSTPTDRQAPGTEESASKSSTKRTLSYIVGGVGLVALGSFAYFGLTGRRDESDLHDRCPRCTQDEVDDVKRKYLIADISAGVGVVALGAAAWLFFSAPSRTDSARRGGVLSKIEVKARPTTGAGFVALSGTF